MFVIVVAIVWVVVVSVYCFRATRTFWTGWILSVAIGIMPFLLLMLPGGFTVREQGLFLEFASTAIFLATIIGILIALQRDDRNQNYVKRCRECGYNLTGNVSGVCPECGSVIV
ncbi:MAG: hypothetical protein R3E58_08470 [Phycisphaerae bacterium]|nr:hypothetical protein [Phycisphaerales bacterium]